MGLKKIFGRKLIGEILVEEGYVEPQDVETALEVQKKEGGLLGEILIRSGKLTEEHLMAGLSKQLNVPFIVLSSYNINRSAVKMIPKKIAEEYLIFAFDQEDEKVFLAMSDPANENVIAEILSSTPLKTQTFLASPTEIRKAIKTFYAG